MNLTTETQKKIRDIYDELSEHELLSLKDRLTGYGFCADAARKLGVHPNTLRYILVRGYGQKKNIEKIRNVLLK